jgi:hypothetical protein
LAAESPCALRVPVFLTLNRQNGELRISPPPAFRSYPASPLMIYNDIKKKSAQIPVWEKIRKRI